MKFRIDPLQADAQRFQYESLLIPRTVELLRIRCELSELITELHKLPKDEIAEVCARHFLEIEYISDAPPPIDLRQQIEQALPANRYRLLRIARRFQN